MYILANEYLSTDVYVLYMYNEFTRDVQPTVVHVQRGAMVCMFWERRLHNHDLLGVRPNRRTSQL